MRIAIVHSFYRTNLPSGENAAVKNQVKLFEAAGHDVCLIKRESDELGKFEIPRLAWNTATFSGADPSKAIDDFRADIVHVHNLFPNFGSRWLHTLNVPHVTTFHNFRAICSAGTLNREGKDCFECPELGSQQAIKHACYRGSKLATIPLAIATRSTGGHNPSLLSNRPKIVLSQFAKQIYEKYFPQSLNLNVIPNFAARGVEVPSVNPGEQKLSWIFIGRLSQEKGIEELLQHWPKKEVINIYGSGPLEAKLKSNFAESQNIVFKGTIDPKDRDRALRESKGLVFPSTCRENSPLVIGEAYSAGVPVIAYAGNVVGEQIKLIGGGAVFEDFDQLASVLSHFDSIREEQLAKVKEIYESEYSPEIWLKRTLDIYASQMRSS